MKKKKSMMKKVLAIVAHPDDEVLGVGGTLAKHAKVGDEVFVLIMCESTSPRDGKKGMEELKRCALKASNILGVKSVFIHDFPNLKTNCVAMSDFITVVRNYLLKIKPEIIYTHHRGDVHLDHQKVFTAVMNGISSVDLNFENVLCFETPSSTEWAPPFIDYSFLPEKFVDILETMSIKIKALLNYDRELRIFPHPRSAEAIKIYAEEWGFRSGLNVPTEAFEIIRMTRRNLK